MGRELIGKSISAFTTFVPTGGLATFTALPGQMAIMFRWIGGGSCEIGGASLVAGNGFLLSANASALPVGAYATGTVYAIATGTTATVTGYRIITAENPGSVG